MTNFTRITTSPEALAMFLDQNLRCDSCCLYETCPAEPRGKECYEVLIEWLQEESDE